MADPTKIWIGMASKFKYGGYPTDMSLTQQTQEDLCDERQPVNVWNTCDITIFIRILIKSTVTGHYAPQLAEMVYERNKHLETNQRINLKGLIVSTENHLIFVFVSQSSELLVCTSSTLYGTTFDRLEMQWLIITMIWTG